MPGLIVLGKEEYMNHNDNLAYHFISLALTYKLSFYYFSNPAGPEAIPSKCNQYNQSLVQCPLSCALCGPNAPATDSSSSHPTMTPTKSAAPTSCHDNPHRFSISYTRNTGEKIVISRTCNWFNR